MTKRIYQLNSGLNKVTGIQRVLMDVHTALQDTYDAKIVGTVPYNDIHTDLGIKNDDYIRFAGYSMFRNSVVIVHERRYLPILWVLNKILKYKIKVVYVHHSILHGRKFITRFPKYIVAISDAGIKNLTEEFGVPAHAITKIHNCVREVSESITKHKAINNNHITILYPARINSIKRQLEIVDRLEGHIDPRVKILFAGDGPEYEALRTRCDGSGQFISLGFCDNVQKLLHEADFMMLFSHHEGLPISMIEAALNSTPIICNDVGGNIEIAIEGRNAFISNNWDELISTLNSLPDIPAVKYRKMSEESRKIYEERFRFERFAKKYQELISKL